MWGAGSATGIRGSNIKSRKDGNLRE